MAKKNFKNSPALQFITAKEALDEFNKEAEPLPEPLEIKFNEPPAVEVKPLELNLHEDIPFTNIVFPIPAKVEIETKSKRVQLVFTPSLHAKIQQEAKALGFSFNEFMCQLATRYFEAKGE